MELVNETYVSQLLNHKIMDAKGKKIGVLKDIYFNIEGTYPIVSAFAIEKGYYCSKGFTVDDHYLIARDIEEHLPKIVSIDGDFSITKVLLDKQIVDTYGYKVVRVNDIKIASINDDLVLIGVDISFKGLLRRLGISGFILDKLPNNLVTWNYIEPISDKYDKIKLNISHQKISHLHPADIADILDDLSIAERKRILDNLDDETVAEALGEADFDTQMEILENLDSERASHILEEMAPDEAADILSQLTEEKSTELLGLMEPDEAQDVRGLMKYEEDTAGALMTTEFISVPETITADETINYLRQSSPEAETMFYLYVINGDKKLTGVVSLRELIIAKPETMLSEIMHKRLIKVYASDNIEKVANSIAKYNLLAVPVVDDQECMLGIITVDDVLDLFMPDRSNLESFAYRIRG